MLAVVCEHLTWTLTIHPSCLSVTLHVPPGMWISVKWPNFLPFLANHQWHLHQKDTLSFTLPCMSHYQLPAVFSSGRVIFLRHLSQCEPSDFYRTPRSLRRINNNELPLDFPWAQRIWECSAWRAEPGRHHSRFKMLSGTFVGGVTKEGVHII